MWTGDKQYRLAPALLTLIGQLRERWPDRAWQINPQTGTIGDAAHRAEGSASDHNPWLARTVRALDVAAGIPGGPDAEALFAMVNRMYAARDARAWPDGYAIFNRRVTDWSHPGGFHAQQGDPHLLHLHISVGQNPAGYNSTAPWPLPGAAPAPQEDDMANYSDWPDKDKQELAGDIVKALLDRQMGGVGFEGTYAAMMAATLSQAKAARTSAVSKATLAEVVRDQLAALPAGGEVDAEALATAVIAKLGDKLGDPA